MTMGRIRQALQADWPYGFVAIAPCILFAPFLLGKAAVYWGTVFFQFYPWRDFTLGMLHQGKLPLWNPYLGNGTPLIANYQSAVFYPPNGLSLLIPLPYSFAWLIVFHLILAGAGMVTFTRSLGLKPFSQAIAGLAFGLSQYLVSRSGFLSMEAALAWLPWIIWAADRLLTNGHGAGKYALILALCTAFQLLSGHAQIAWYTGLFLIGWLIYRVLTHRIHWPRILLAAGSIVLAVGLASIQLIPTAEFQVHSQRSHEFGYPEAMTYSYWPPRLASFIAPDLLGNPGAGNYTGYGSYWEDADYLGILPLILIIGLLLSRLKSRSRPAGFLEIAAPSRAPDSLIVFLGLSMLVSFGLALGSHTHLFPFLYHHIPTFNLFQAPTRFMVLFEFCASLLAAVAADEWLTFGQKSTRLFRLGVMGVTGMGFLAILGDWIFFTMTGNPGKFVIYPFALVSPVILIIGNGILGSRKSATSDRSPRVYILAAFLALDLIYAGSGLNPPAPVEIYSAQPLTWSPTGDRVLEYEIDQANFFNRQTFGSPVQVIQAAAYALANTNMVAGVASENNYDPILENRYSHFLDRLYRDMPGNVLALADVGMITRGSSSGTIQLVAPPGKPSRVWIVHSTQTVASGDEALSALFAPGFDPSRTIILEKNDPGTLGSRPIPFEHPTRPISSETAQIILSTPGNVKIAVSLSQAGYLVLSDTFYPGWYAYVDGQPVRMLHADYAFRGVTVPSGSHMIEFRYRPLSFLVGAWTSGISWGIFLGLVLLSGWIGGRERKARASFSGQRFQ